MKPCVTSGAARDRRRDAGLRFPHHLRRIVSLDHGDAIVDFRIVAVEVTRGQRGQQRVADDRRIEPHDREAEHRDLRRAAAVVGQFEQRHRRDQRVVVAERSDMMASRCVPGGRRCGRPRCDLKADEARRQRIAHLSRRSSGHAASSNVRLCVIPLAKAQAIDRHGVRRRRAAAARCRAACRPATHREPGAARSRCWPTLNSAARRRSSSDREWSAPSTCRLTSVRDSSVSNSVANCAAAVRSVRCMRSRSAVLNWPSHWYCIHASAGTSSITSPTRIVTADTRRPERSRAAFRASWGESSTRENAHKSSKIKHLTSLTIPLLSLNVLTAAAP